LERALWVTQFQLLFLAALRVAWLDHGSALRALGARSEDFYQCARGECVQFLSGCADTSTLKETAASPAGATAVHG
jgi:hypothetical protein